MRFTLRLLPYFTHPKLATLKPGSHLWNRLRSRSRRRRKYSVNMREVSEARVKYEARTETIISKNFDILLHLMLQNWPCFTLASWFLSCERVKQCAQGSFSWSKRKTCKKKKKSKWQHSKKINFLRQWENTQFYTIKQIGTPVTKLKSS